MSKMANKLTDSVRKAKQQSDDNVTTEEKKAPMTEKKVTAKKTAPKKAPAKKVAKKATVATETALPKLSTRRCWPD